MSGKRGRMSGWAMGSAASPAGDAHQKLRNRLTLPGPEDAAAGLKRGDDLDGARILVPVLQIRPYDRNPRRAINLFSSVTPPRKPKRPEVRLFTYKFIPLHATLMV